MQLVLHSLSLIMLDPSKNTTKKVRFAIFLFYAIPSSYYNRYTDPIIYFFLETTFSHLPWHMSLTTEGTRPPFGHHATQANVALNGLLLWNYFFQRCPWCQWNGTSLRLVLPSVSFLTKCWGELEIGEDTWAVAHRKHRNLSNDFWLKGNLRKDRVERKSFGLWERFESKNVHFHHKLAKCRKVN